MEEGFVVELVEKVGWGYVEYMVLSMKPIQVGGDITG